MYRPSQVFAALTDLTLNPSAAEFETSFSTFAKMQEDHNQNLKQKKTQGKVTDIFSVASDQKVPAQTNVIQVCATAEQTLQPDRCRITAVVQSVKEAVQDAKNSVSRRLDYIKQTLYKYHIQDHEISISRTLRLVDGAYHYDAEVTATFIEHEKCEEFANILVEKLDGSVKLTAPEFFQSPVRLENLRKQASLAAVRNAKQKAMEMAQLLNASVGKALSICEEECSEWEGNNDRSNVEGPVTIQQRKNMAAVTVSVQISAVFELKPKGRSKEAK